MARMRYEIVLSPEAIEDLKGLRASLRAQVKDAMETHLRHEPTKTSKSRIKRLRGLAKPQYRLRVDSTRVFYDVARRKVEVLAIAMKEGTETGLPRAGEMS